MSAVKLNSLDYETSARMPSGQVLDSPEGTQHTNKYSYELAEIMDAMELKADMAGFETIARDLSKLAHQEPAWTKKYIHSVFHERLYPSPALSIAIDKLAQTVDGTPASIAGTEWVKCLAYPGTPEGTYIPPGLKRVKCERPGCPVYFFRASPRQKYCCDDCREWAYSLLTS